MSSAERGQEPSYPFHSAVRLEVEPEYAKLRADHPVSRVRLPYGGSAWLVTRYHDVRKVLTDRRFSRHESARPEKPGVSQEGAPGSSIITMDPPQHTRVRRLVAKVFTPRRVEALRPQARRLVDRLLGEMAEQDGPIDLVSGLALPVPLAIICDLLGVPYGDRDRFRRFSEAVVSTTAYSAAEVADAETSLYVYLSELVRARRAAPADDLLGALVLARDEQEQLSEEELVNFAATLLIVGHETAATQIANHTYTLLQRPQQLARLREDPALVEAAVDELLRFIPLGSAGAFPRVALEDVEVADTTIRRGETVVASLASADHDPTVFNEPDRLDVTRSPNPHLAFGHGIHHCLGAQLARMELQVTIGALMREFPELRIAVPESELEWKKGLLVRGLRWLPVDLGPRLWPSSARPEER